MMSVTIKAVAVLAGLALAALAQYLALAMAGGGHGWVAPLFYSMLLFIVYPVAFLSRTDTAHPSIAIDVGLLVVAGAADLLLLVQTVTQEGRYFMLVAEMGGPLMAFWLVLWCLWQMLALSTLRRRIARRDADGFY
jgi:hypothetical protein